MLNNSFRGTYIFVLQHISNNIRHFIEYFYFYQQVECNTKLDPTKTTLLKVKA